jgi:uncharacterized oligopeptide transporter (OPT) family protein
MTMQCCRTAFTSAICRNTPLPAHRCLMTIMLAVLSQDLKTAHLRGLAPSSQLVAMLIGHCCMTVHACCCVAGLQDCSFIGCGTFLAAGGYANWVRCLRASVSGGLPAVHKCMAGVACKSILLLFSVSSYAVSSQCALLLQQLT